MFVLPIFHSSKENWLTPVSPLFCSLFRHPAEPPPCPYFSLVLTFPSSNIWEDSRVICSCFKISLDVVESANICDNISCQALLLLSDRAICYLQVPSVCHLHSVQIPRHQCLSVSIIVLTTDMACIKSYPLQPMKSQENKRTGLSKMILNSLL